MERIIIILSIIIVVSVAVLGIIQSDYREKSFNATLAIKQSDVVKISMEINGKTKTTTDQVKINELFTYFNRVSYKRLRGDQTSHMPSKAAIIYLDGNKQHDFIVPYNNEAMISYKVYQVKHGQITNDFYIKYYHRLDNS